VACVVQVRPLRTDHVAQPLRREAPFPMDSAGCDGRGPGTFRPMPSRSASQSGQDITGKTSRSSHPAPSERAHGFGLRPSAARAYRTTLRGLADHRCAGSRDTDPGPINRCPGRPPPRTMPLRPGGSPAPRAKPAGRSRRGAETSSIPGLPHSARTSGSRKPARPRPLRRPRGSPARGTSR
jgi:hypothetical protein